MIEQVMDHFTHLKNKPKKKDKRKLKNYTFSQSGVAMSPSSYWFMFFFLFFSSLTVIDPYHSLNFFNRSLYDCFS